MEEPTTVATTMGETTAVPTTIPPVTALPLPTTTLDWKAESEAARQRRRQREYDRAIAEAEETGVLGGEVGEAGISAAEFAAIQPNMTVDQVRSIVGSPGSVLAETQVAGIAGLILNWPGEAGALGANANVQFQNGLVISKAQYGL